MQSTDFNLSLFLCSVPLSSSGWRRSECSGSFWSFELRTAVWWRKLVSYISQSTSECLSQFSVLPSYFSFRFAAKHTAELSKAREGYVLKRVAEERAAKLIQYQREVAEELVVAKVKAKDCLEKAIALEKQLEQERSTSEALTLGQAEEIAALRRRILRSYNKIMSKFLEPLICVFPSSPRAGR